MKSNPVFSNKKTLKTPCILSAILSDEMILYIKTRKASCGGTGKRFIELQQLFGNQYQLLGEAIDEIAERIHLCQKTIGTLHEFLELSSNKNNQEHYYSSKDTLIELLKDNEIVIVQLRQNMDEKIENDKDIYTYNFIESLLEQHETNAYALKISLKEEIKYTMCE